MLKLAFGEQHLKKWNDKPVNEFIKKIEENKMIEIERKNGDFLIDNKRILYREEKERDDR